MASDVLSRHPMENVSEIVDRTIVLVDRLKCALIQQENLTKGCFETNATELSKTVESNRKAYVRLCEEYEVVREEVKAGEKRLLDTQQEYEGLVKENGRLKEMESGLLNSETVADEPCRESERLRSVLRAYKQLTGVRFDWSKNEDLLTGYVAISGNKPTNSTIIPFEKDPKSNLDSLWHTINEACSEIVEQSPVTEGVVGH